MEGKKRKREKEETDPEIRARVIESLSKGNISTEMIIDREERKLIAVVNTTS